ncbi:hypothetical protein AOQ84DRAFT_225745, partial [Glonium stellatum]
MHNTTRTQRPTAPARSPSRRAAPSQPTTQRHRPQEQQHHHQHHQHQQHQHQQDRPNH